MNTGYLEIGTENIFKTAFTSELCTLLQENLSYSSAKSSCNCKQQMQHTLGSEKFDSLYEPQTTKYDIIT